MDDFQRAAAAARGRYTDAAWTALPPPVQAAAIYAELRRIDAEQAARVFPRRKRRPASRDGTAAPVESRVPPNAD
jgi:hypothetical protein